MLKSIYSDLKLIQDGIQQNMSFTLSIIGLLFVIHLINALTKYRLNNLGIYPRHPFGLLGIFSSPFLHGNFNHIFFNSIPLFALINMILLYGHQVFWCVTLIVGVLGGGLVWMFGRRAIHVGASTVIMGYFGFLTIQSILNPNFISVLLILVCLFYFGGLVSSLFNTDKGVSFEGHMFGFMSGVLSFQLCPYFL